MKITTAVTDYLNHAMWYVDRLADLAFAYTIAGVITEAEYEYLRGMYTAMWVGERIS